MTPGLSWASQTPRCHPGHPSAAPAARAPGGPERRWSITACNVEIRIGGSDLDLAVAQKSGIPKWVTLVSGIMGTKTCGLPLRSLNFEPFEPLVVEASLDIGGVGPSKSGRSDSPHCRGQPPNNELGLMNRESNIDSNLF